MVTFFLTYRWVSDRLVRRLLSDQECRERPIRFGEDCED